MKLESSCLTKFLINDGIIDKNYLKELNKDEKWLLSELNIDSKRALKNILVAFYDEKNKKFDVPYKNNKI